MLDMPDDWSDEQVKKAAQEDRKAAIDSAIAQAAERIESYMRNSFNTATIEGVLAMLKGPVLEAEQVHLDDALDHRWGPDLTKGPVRDREGRVAQVVEVNPVDRGFILRAMIASSLRDEEEGIHSVITQAEFDANRNARLIVERITGRHGTVQYRVRREP